jgi:hypothetical protein
MNLYTIRFQSATDKLWKDLQFAAPDAASAVRAFAEGNPAVNDFRVEYGGEVSLVEVAADGGSVSVRDGRTGSSQVL